MNKNSSIYQELYRDFKWEIPKHYNIGYDVSEKWAIKTPDNPAIIEVFPDGNLKETSYLEFDTLVNRGANCLSKTGVKKGDRIGLLPYLKKLQKLVRNQETLPLIINNDAI